MRVANVALVLTLCNPSISTHTTCIAQPGLASFESISAELGSLTSPPTPHGQSPTARGGVAEQTRRETLQEGLFAGLGALSVCVWGGGCACTCACVCVLPQCPFDCLWMIQCTDTDEACAVWLTCVH